MGKINIRKVKCIVCKNEIKVWSEVLVKTRPYVKETKSRNHQDSFSDEGVLFSDETLKKIGVWFCNECWNKIIKRINKKKKIKNQH